MLKKITRSFLISLPLAFFSVYLDFLNRFRPFVASGLFDDLRRLMDKRTFEVAHESEGEIVSLILGTPNSLCLWRAVTFSEKEPETLAWIDKYGGRDGVFFDVGANVGLYSLYFARKWRGRVYAFEPSVKNLATLSENIFQNGLTENVTMFPLPLSDSKDSALFSLSSSDEGGALAWFGPNLDQRNPMKIELSYRVPGLSLYDVITLGLVEEPPTLLKIDVDGIENLILRGAQQTLRSPSLRSVLVEVDESQHRTTEDVYRQLEEAGFSLESREHAQMFDEGLFASVFNLIWVRAESEG